MNLKSLFAVGCLMAAVSASASYPLYFRDTVNEGGHMRFAQNEDGTPAFNEDGSITLTRIEGDGVYFRTKKLGTAGQEPTEKAANTGYCDPKYTVLAFEYKSNMPVDNVVIFHHEGFGNYADVTSGNMIEATDEYKTCYAFMNRQATTWGYGDGYENNYNWISFNSTEIGWELTVKNLRLLTPEEAAAECQVSTANVVEDLFIQLNLDFGKDYDDDMGSDLYAKVGVNPVLATAELIKPLPNGVTKLCFDYKLMGTTYEANFLVNGPGGPVVKANIEALGEDEDPYEAEWKTLEVDLADAMASVNFAQTFGSRNRVWFQSINMANDDMIWIKNVRWEGPKAPEPPSVGYPIYFRDTVNEGGHMRFAQNEDGTPAFNEDGSITLTRIEGDGVYFRTKKLGTAGQEPTEKAANTGYCDPKYTVLAFEYKSNMPVDNVVIFHHEGFGNYADVTSGNMIEVTDEYKTCYALMNRQATTWGYGDGYENNYNWISFNNTEIGWELTVKNLRLLTLEEAAAECQSSTANVVEDEFIQLNLDFGKDYDDDMGSDLYAKVGVNPVLATAELIKPLPNGVTKLCFDYKLMGTTYEANFHVNGAGGPVVKANVVALGEDEDPYEAEWKTLEVDLADAMASVNFAQTFGSRNRVWFQSINMANDDMIWIKNVRWESNTVGVANVEVAAPADGRTYNLMGVEIKGELAPGIYIRNGKKFIVR